MCGWLGTICRSQPTIIMMISDILPMLQFSAHCLYLASLPSIFWHYVSQFFFLEVSMHGKGIQIE